MLEMREVEEDDAAPRFEEEFNVWLSDEPLTNNEICQLMRTVERERKLGRETAVSRIPPPEQAPEENAPKNRKSPLHSQSKRFADTASGRQRAQSRRTRMLGRENLRPCATGRTPNSDWGEHGGANILDDSSQVGS